MTLRGIVAIDRTTAVHPATKGLPERPQTLGEHIRYERMKRGLLQKDIAHIIGVNEMTVTNWENNKRKAQMRYMPKMVEFLNFVPDCLKDFTPLKNKIFLYRCKDNLTQREVARNLGVDITTLHALELGKRKMIERTKSMIDNYQKLKSYCLS